MKTRLPILTLIASTFILLSSCNAKSAISAQEAQNIALQKANVTVDLVQHLTIKADRDDGKLLYDVRFIKDRIEYEYEIDAQSGAVLSEDIDPLPYG